MKNLARVLSLAVVAAASLALTVPALATDFTFDSDPFAGSTAPTTPGRQIVAGEDFISFDAATDRFVFDAAVFGVGPLFFVNAVIGAIPTSGVNAIVLETFDNDADAGTPFGAGIAANLLADQITSPGAGFFVYFNSGLQAPRLVYSTDLSDNTADLKILARLTNLTDDSGALEGFTADNFHVVTSEPAPVPEEGGPAIFVTMFLALVVMAYRGKRLNRIEA